MGLEEFALKLLTVIIEAVGLEGLRSILNKHPVTRGQIIAAERGAADLALDALEDKKLAEIAAEETKP